MATGLKRTRKQERKDGEAYGLVEKILADGCPKKARL